MRIRIQLQTSRRNQKTTASKDVFLIQLTIHRSSEQGNGIVSNKRFHYISEIPRRSSSNNTIDHESIAREREITQIYKDLSNARATVSRWEVKQKNAIYARNTYCSQKRSEVSICMLNLLSLTSWFSGCLKCAEREGVGGYWGRCRDW